MGFNSDITGLMNFFLEGSELFSADRQTYRQTDRQAEMTVIVVALGGIAKQLKSSHVTNGCKNTPTA